MFPHGSRALTLVAGMVIGATLPRPVAAPRTIPTPESVLGFAVGADYKMATYEESVRYCQALAASSARHPKGGAGTSP